MLHDQNMKQHFSFNNKHILDVIYWFNWILMIDLGCFLATFYAWMGNFGVSAGRSNPTTETFQRQMDFLP